ncbi:MAG TPA: hypothetical protein DIV86_04345 [Alphaproteobacteria bacterium]|nr:hypothetical protein [Alphaproteobacteria bacterium]
MCNNRGHAETFILEIDMFYEKPTSFKEKLEKVIKDNTDVKEEQIENIIEQNFPASYFYDAYKQLSTQQSEFNEIISKPKDYVTVNYVDYKTINRPHYSGPEIDISEGIKPLLDMMHQATTDALRQTLKDLATVNKEIAKLEPKDLDIYNRATEIGGAKLVAYQFRHPKHFPDTCKAGLYLGMASGLAVSGAVLLEPFKFLRGAMLGYAAEVWKCYPPLRDPVKLIKNSLDFGTRSFVLEAGVKIKSFVGLVKKGSLEKEVEKSQYGLAERMIETPSDAFKIAKTSNKMSFIQSGWEIFSGDFVGGITRLVGATSAFINNSLMDLALSKSSEEYFSSVKERYQTKLKTLIYGSERT